MGAKCHDYEDTWCHVSTEEALEPAWGPVAVWFLPEGDRALSHRDGGGLCGGTRIDTRRCAKGKGTGSAWCDGARGH